MVFLPVIKIYVVNVISLLLGNDILWGSTYRIHNKNFCNFFLVFGLFFTTVFSGPWRQLSIPGNLSYQNIEFVILKMICMYFEIEINCPVSRREMFKQKLNFFNFATIAQHVLQIISVSFVDAYVCASGPIFNVGDHQCELGKPTC